MKKNYLLSLLFLFISSLTLAQSKSVTTTITAKIPEALSLEVVAGNSIDFDFTSDLNLLTRGIEKQNAVILSYKSNKPWFVTINALTANFSGGDASNPMPSTVINFKNNASSVYAPLSTTAVGLSGTANNKNPKGSSTIGIDYKLVPGFDYSSASDYSIGISYTISSI